MLTALCATIFMHAVNYSPLLFHFPSISKVLILFQSKCVSYFRCTVHPTSADIVQQFSQLFLRLCSVHGNFFSNRFILLEGFLFWVAVFGSLILHSCSRLDTNCKAVIISQLKPRTTWAFEHFPNVISAAATPDHMPFKRTRCVPVAACGLHSLNEHAWRNTHVGRLWRLKTHCYIAHCTRISFTFSPSKTCSPGCG